MSREHGIVGATVGGDIGKHVYREGNQRADELTHIARQGNLENDATTELRGYHIHALRGGFDGGVDKDGAGAGYWLEGLIQATADHPLYGPFAYMDRKAWVTLREKAFMLDHNVSAMHAEFEALSSLCEAILSLSPYLCRKRARIRTAARFPRC